MSVVHKVRLHEVHPVLVGEAAVRTVVLLEHQRAARVQLLHAEQVLHTRYGTPLVLYSDARPASVESDRIDNRTCL